MKKKMKIILESAKGSELGWDHIPPFVMDLFYCFFLFSFFFFHFYGLFCQTRLLPFLDVTKNKRYTHPSWMGAFSLLGGFDLGFSQFLYRVLSAFCSALLPVVFDLAEVQLWSSFDPALILF